jgi:hypothetical protein
MKNLFYEYTLETEIVTKEEFENFEKEYNLKIYPKSKEIFLEFQRLSIKLENSSFLIKDYYGNNCIISFSYFFNFQTLVSANFINNLKKKDSGFSFYNQENILLVGDCDFGHKIGLGINLENLKDKVFFIPYGDPTDFVAENDFSLIYPSIEVAPDLEFFLLMLTNPEELEKNL